jgi:cyclic pyranopterin phosphate synthase
VSNDGSDGLTHFQPDGRVQMVDVSEKPITRRRAVAEAVVEMDVTTYQQILNRQMKKGDVLSVAELAGVMGAKQTSTLIPLCHPLPLTHVSIQCDWTTPGAEDKARLSIRATVRTTGQTGVEMEALTACTVAALTVYDMCKAVDQQMVIESVRLLHKSGGKRGTFEAP